MFAIIFVKVVLLFFLNLKNPFLSDDNAFCVVSCEPNSSDILSNVKHLSIKGKVTSIVDDHGLVDDYIYFHFKGALVESLFLLSIV